MKEVFEIRKLFLVINSVLLAILVYIAAGFICSDDTVTRTIPRQICAAEPGKRVCVGEPLLPRECELIVQRNIFGSCESGSAGEKPAGSKKENPLSSLSAQLRLVATVAGDEQVACAVVGNLKSRIQDIYKTGDIVGGAQIERIDRNKLVLSYEEQREVLNLRISQEEPRPARKKEGRAAAESRKGVDCGNVVCSGERGVNQKVYVTNTGGMQTFLKKMKAAPYIVNGKGEGLCITGLDDLSMAGFFGFKDGDVIQKVNGQVLTDKQKAFQVLKKARSQSSLDFEVLRDKEELDLSFDINR
jgi:type II secretion system protein C